MNEGSTNHERCHTDAAIKATVWIEGWEKNRKAHEAHRGYRWWVSDHDTGGQTVAGIARNVWLTKPEAKGMNVHPVIHTLFAFVDGCESYIMPDPRGNDDERELYSRLVQIVDDCYEHLVWDPLRCGALDDHWRVRWALFDSAVSMGLGSAVKAAQASTGAASDGIVGPQTVECINRFVREQGPERFNDLMRRWRINNAHAIVERHEHQRPNLKGWINRAEKVAGKAERLDAAGRT